MCLSATLAAEVTTECTTFSLLSTPMCALGSEVPLVALLGLMHFRVALASGVLRRTGRMDNGRVHDGAGGDADAFAFQVAVHHVQHFAAQIVLLKQVAEAKNRGLVRRCGHTKVNPS